MFCPKCGCKNRDGAKFCAECGNPMPQEGGAAPATGATVTQASATPSEADPNATESTGKLGAFLRKPVNFLGHTVPMFGAILAILLATAGIATAAFLIYQNTVAAQEQQQEQVVKTKKVKKAKKKVEEKTEEVEEEEKPADQPKTPQRSASQSATSDSSSAPTPQEEQEATEEVEPPTSAGQDQVTEPVASSYDPASEVGGWTGNMLQFGYSSNSVKSGSTGEGSIGCGKCYGATQHPLKLNITSVDANSRTASGTVSFLLHAHNGNIGSDESSDPGDVYIENVPFTSISIDGWHSINAADIYSGNGKTVQMSLRLKYGSLDDYSVWIRTVKAEFPGPHDLMWSWGQTDMYTITKN